MSSPLSGRSDRGERVEIGRYTIFGPIGAGGMATVHFGRLRGDAGFSRTVAIKRLYDSLAHDPDFVVMMLDEARLAARVRHPNVISTLDVVHDRGELLIVMEYVHGTSLARLFRAAREQREAFPIPIALSIVTSALHGLHAAHEAKGDLGEPLSIIHRDVSPQNLLVGADGVTRVIDFGVAKAAGRAHTTRDGQLKGKLAYMAPEQLRHDPLDARVDVHAAAIVLWELLTGRRLWDGESDAAIVNDVLNGVVESPSRWRSDIPASLDAIVQKGLARNREDRFRTAYDFALALQSVASPAPAHDVGRWVGRVAATELQRLEGELAEIEADRTRTPSSSGPTTSSSEPGGETRSAVSVRMEDRPKRHRSRMTLVGLVGLGIGVAAISFASIRGRGTTSAAPTVAPAIVAPSPPSGATTETSASAPTGARAPSPSIAASAMPSATPNANLVPAQTPKNPATTRRPPRPTVNRCDPPYYVDSTGVKIVKPQCR